MKAIYINLDPYIAAFAAWLKAGKPGTAPSFGPLPLAVTIPLAQDVCFLWMGNAAETPVVTADGVSGINVYPRPETAIGFTPITEEDAQLHQIPLSQFSAINSTGFSVATITGDFSISFLIGKGDDEIFIPFTVLVRRETASGPVDIFDFTPPASAIAAGTDLKGTKFNGNEIVAADGTGALSAPAGA